MELKTKHSNDIAILELHGRYDAYSMHLVDEWLSQAKQQVVIDLSRINFIDNAALKSLTRNAEQRQKQKGYIRLCNLSQPVQIIMELTNYKQVLDIRESQLQAVENTARVLVA